MSFYCNNCGNPNQGLCDEVEGTLRINEWSERCCKEVAGEKKCVAQDYWRDVTVTDGPIEPPADTLREHKVTYTFVPRTCEPEVLDPCCHNPPDKLCYEALRDDHWEPTTFDVIDHEC